MSASVATTAGARRIRMATPARAGDRNGTPSGRQGAGRPATIIRSREMESAVGLPAGERRELVRLFRPRRLEIGREVPDGVVRQRPVALEEAEDVVGRLVLRRRVLVAVVAAAHGHRLSGGSMQMILALGLLTSPPGRGRRPLR